MTDRSLTSDLLTELLASFPDKGQDPRTGIYPGMPAAEYDRLWLARVAHKTIRDANGCWVWQGFILHKGYGGTTYRSRNTSVHRQVYKILVKPDLATEDFVCHTCDNRPCWNPAHLWLGDPLSNQQDKNAKRRNYFTNLTHCKHGHEFTPENTYIRKGQPNYGYGPSRACKECMRIHARKQWQKRRANSSQVTP